MDSALRIVKKVEANEEAFLSRTNLSVIKKIEKGIEKAGFSILAPAEIIDEVIVWTLEGDDAIVLQACGEMSALAYVDGVGMESPVVYFCVYTKVARMNVELALRRLFENRPAANAANVAP